MSLLTVGIVNGILAVAIVAGLTYVCRMPYRLDRVARPKELLAGSEALKQRELAYERYAA
jgi:hypothetical protein